MTQPPPAAASTEAAGRKTKTESEGSFIVVLEEGREFRDRATKRASERLILLVTEKRKTEKSALASASTKKKGPLEGCTLKMEAKVGKVIHCQSRARDHLKTSFSA